MTIIEDGIVVWGESSNLRPDISAYGSLGHYQLKTINAIKTIIQAVVMNNNRSATSKARDILLAAGKLQCYAQAQYF